jgi:hypothetical protein
MASSQFSGLTMPAATSKFDHCRHSSIALLFPSTKVQNHEGTVGTAGARRASITRAERERRAGGFDLDSSHAPVPLRFILRLSAVRDPAGGVDLVNTSGCRSQRIRIGQLRLHVHARFDRSPYLLLQAP